MPELAGTKNGKFHLVQWNAVQVLSAYVQMLFIHDNPKCPISPFFWCTDIWSAQLNLQCAT